MLTHEIQFIGNLGKDPEGRYTPGGQFVCNFSVAVNEKYTDKNTGEKVENTDWFNCAAWGKAGETINQYLRKGSKVFIRGKMTRDPKKGGPRVFQRGDDTWDASWEVTVREFNMLGDNGSGGSSGRSSQPASADAAPPASAGW